jgi:hypothetical protein
MKKKLDRELPLNEVRDFLKRQLEAALGISYETCSLSDLMVKCKV